MATVMVWQTNAFGSFRVLVEKVSVNGMAALVKFTRGERYRPVEAGKDGTMWVAASTLHKVASKAAESPVKASTVKRTGVTDSKPPKARKRTSVASEFSNGAIAF